MFEFSLLWYLLFYHSKESFLLTLLLKFEKREERKRVVLFAYLLPECLQWPGLGGAKGRSQELSPGPLSGWEPNYLKHQLLPPCVYISRKLESQVQLALQYGMWGSTGNLTAELNGLIFFAQLYIWGNGQNIFFLSQKCLKFHFLSWKIVCN